MRLRPAAAAAILAAALAALPALTAANAVPVTRADSSTQAITANDLRPPQCGFPLDQVVVGTNGTAQRDLLLGGPAGQTMRGRGNRDCILGGGGNDRLIGNAGNDVCIGGPGFDTFDASCEVQIQ